MVIGKMYLKNSFLLFFLQSPFFGGARAPRAPFWVRHCSAETITVCNGEKLKDCLGREADREISKINRPRSTGWKEEVPLRCA